MRRLIQATRATSGGMGGDMLLIAIKEVPIAQLRLPGNWKQILDDPSVPVLAISRKIMALHDPMVRKSDWRLIHGNRRVAAALHNGDTHILVKIIDCSDAEADLIAKMENAHREHMSREDVKKLVDAFAEQIAQMEPANDRPSSVRIKLPKTIAREIVADTLGVTPEAVKKSLQRERRRVKRLKAAADHDADVGIRSPWAQLDDDFKRQTNRIIEVTNGAAQLLQKAMQQLTLMMQAKTLPLHEGRLTKTYESIAVSSAALRALLPTCLCPYCKGVPKLQPKCLACMTTGYITRGQEPGVPDELWNEEHPVVMDDGQLVGLEQYYELAS